MRSFTCISLHVHFFCALRIINKIHFPISFWLMSLLKSPVIVVIPGNWVFTTVLTIVASSWNDKKIPEILLSNHNYLACTKMLLSLVWCHLKAKKLHLCWFYRTGIHLYLHFLLSNRLFSNYINKMIGTVSLRKIYLGFNGGRTTNPLLLTTRWSRQYNARTKSEGTAVRFPLKPKYIFRKDTVVPIILFI